MKISYSKLLLTICVVFCLFNSTNINAQCLTGAEDDTTHPKRDLRGVFIPSLFNISWPSSASLTTAQQQAELIQILDDLQINGYNSVFLQIRPAGDALYASTIEPWSHWLTGTEGTPPSPYYDPLEFAVNESHARGLDLHVWLNPYRVKYGAYATHTSHVISENPDWTFEDSSNSTRIILDPGLPQVRDYIVSIVEDISSRYDIDGLHFDDYFYPKNGMANFQDEDTFDNHNPGGLSLSNWRRDNVNQMIEMVYNSIQTINTNDNKNVVFGVSPFGIWKNGVPSGTTGTSSYDALYCDTIAWMQAGTVDYIAPQVYWDLNSSGQDYNLLTQWWNDQADATGTQVYVGQAYYKMDAPQNWPASEIQGQVNFNRSASMDATFGQIAYRYNEIDSNLKGINTALNGSQFQYKSFAPPISGTGKDNICPEEPDNIRFGDLKLEWDTPVAAVDSDLPAKYVVYEFASAAEAISNKNDGSKILDIVAGNELDLTQSQIDTKFLVVTALDKNNNEAGDSCNFPLPDITAACSVASLTAPTAKKNCSGSFTGTTSAVFPIESTTVVTWSYNFGGGETYIQSQNVIIEDDTVPTVITQNITVTLTGASNTISASDINNGSSDNCAIDFMSLDIDTFSCKDVGVNPVLLTVFDKNGNSASSTAMVTVEAELTEYTLAGWSNLPPHLGSLAKISTSYNTNVASIDACLCEITPTGTMIVEESHYLKVFGDISVEGTLQVDHRGSVVQVDDNASVTKVGAGIVNVDVSTPGLKDRDFVIMGSPLDGTTRETTLGGVWKVFANTPGNFIPHVDVTSTHGTTFADDNGNDWNSFTTGGLDAGEGYIVRPVYDHGATPVVYDYSFTEGTLNNGVISRPLVSNGAVNNPGGTPNVFSNPYASAISTDAFMALNTDIAAVYFWEHITLPSSAIDGYASINFDMDDISIFNGVMGTPAANDAVAPGATPTNIMSTGQGFGVLATTNGTVTFNNSMRLTAGNDEMRNAQSIVESLLFNVRNEDFGVGSYAGVAFTDFTTEGIDARYDTDRITTSVSLYSHLEDGSEALAIQSRELFDDSIQIPMGFVSQIDAVTEFIFSITDVVGAEVTGVDVILLDTFTGITTNLSGSNYEFSSDIGQFDGRFLITFNSEVLGTQVNLEETLSVYPNPTNDVINIVSPRSVIQQVTVYDMMARTVLHLGTSNQNNVQLDLSSLHSALYFVEIATENGTITKRIIKK